MFTPKIPKGTMVVMVRRQMPAIACGRWTCAEDSAR